MKNKSLILLFFYCLAVASCDMAKSTEIAVLPEYPILKLKNQKITLYAEYPTILEGVETVEIRSKIDGYIEAVYVEEGSLVQSGQKLFKIDSNRFLQDVNQRRAAVLAIEASLETASIQVNRTQALVDKNIVNSFELTTAKNLESVKKAELNQAKAALSDAQSQLAFTQIVSPISGIVGRLPLKKGSLVSSNSATALTTIANTEEIYAFFSLSQKQLNPFLNQYDGKTLSEKLENSPEISLITSEGNSYDKPGKIQSLSGVINSQTGAANFKALFPNPNRVLWSGSSAILRIPTTIAQAILVPKKAVFEIQNRHFVYKVDAQNKATHLEIELFPSTTTQEYVVVNGLQEGDIIITEGLGSLRNGMTIQPSANSTK